MARLTEHRVSAVPVVNDAGLVLGVVSEADLLLKEEHPDPDADLPLIWTKRRRAEHDKAAAAVARDLMTVALVSISPEATAAQAARRMHTAQVKRLPVVDTRGRLVGIVSRSDLLKVFNRPDEAIRREIIDEVIVGEFMMDPDRFFIQVHQGVAVLEGRVERRDRRGPVLVLMLGVGLFGLAYAGFAAGGTTVLALAPWFLAGGVAIGCVETAEHAAVAALAPVGLRGSAFGLLAAVQSFGNLAASAVAGLLWTAVSPRVAFGCLVVWMSVALAGLLTADRRGPG